jgi:hypothetical protein
MLFPMMQRWPGTRGSHASGASGVSRKSPFVSFTPVEEGKEHTILPFVFTVRRTRRPRRGEPSRPRTPRGATTLLIHSESVAS